MLHAECTTIVALDDMATLQVRLPDDVHEVLRRRAAAQGISLTTLVAAVLAESAAEPTTDEWLAGWHARHDGEADPERLGDLDTAALLDAVREDDDPR